MSGRDQAPKKRRRTWKDHLGLGLVVLMPVGPVLVGVSLATGNWLLPAIALPAIPAVTLLAGTLARTRAAAALGSVARTGFVVDTVTLLGLFLGAVAGIALIWFGIRFNLSAKSCDPATYDCVTRGPSAGSATGRELRRLLLSLILIAPGATLLFLSSRGLWRWLRVPAESADPDRDE
ncbi:hypothetical protein [Amycolatopsis samaneae]|uniref:Uncharacterized protein n=1 Tax=Amycolatopsis samaneae TaxID=664691 RepID=A0ABW5GRT2_9PSEU